MYSETFGVHEVTDLRELINFKANCLSKSKTRLVEVQDPDLKLIVVQSIEKGSMTVKQMQEYLVRQQIKLINKGGNYMVWNQSIKQK